MNVIYMIDGKPHRVCDCPQMEPKCPRDGHQRTGMTCGYATCMIPAPDVVTALPTEALPTQNDLRECVDFWAHYSSLNESCQDDINDERHAWLAKMDKWAGRSDGGPEAP